MTVPNHPPPVVPPIVDTLVHHLTREHPPWRLPALRDAHPKHHLVVAAEFVVDEQVPAHLRHGVLAEPGRRFRAWVRFSNALKVRHDLDLDARGMAVKLLGVPREPVDSDNEPCRTQDFLSVTHKAFFSRTAADFLDFPATVLDPSSAGRNARVFGYFVSLRPPRLRARGFIALARSMRWIVSPLVCKYFSQTPYQLGPTCQVKFALVPRQRASWAERFHLIGRLLVYNARAIARLPRDQWHDYLREALIAHLATRDATFDFLVQERIQGAGDRMPLDDAVVVWSEWRSPYRKVATLRFPVQRYSAEEIETLMQLGQHLSYSPWHTLEAHRPLGSINEARRTVYDAISSHRHHLNGRKRREPCDGETPEEYLGSL